MEHAFLAAALWFCAIGCGLLAGVYFTFSAFAMKAFETLGPAAGIAAMNAINERIVRSAFLPLFMGTTLVGAGLVGWGFWRWGAAGSAAAVAGGAIHAIGMFGVTMARNVPLNDALAASVPGSEESAATWRAYLAGWTRWNHLRTVSCTVATALFITAIAARN